LQPSRYTPVIVAAVTDAHFAAVSSIRRNNNNLIFIYYSCKQTAKPQVQKQQAIMQDSTHKIERKAKKPNITQVLARV